MRAVTTYYHYLPYAILYFFLNNVFLPQGLLFTTLLTPVFLYWLYKEGELNAMLLWTLILFIPLPFQILKGVEYSSYVISSILILSAWVFFFTALKTVKRISDSLGKIFRSMLIINSWLVLIALLILPFTALRRLMWDSTPISHHISAFPRLNLFAYEPSHYALLLTPVFLYFILMALSGKLRHPWIYMLGIFIPLLLSLSFGVIGALLLALIIVFLVYFRSFDTGSRRIMLYVSVIAFLLIIAFTVIFPDNPVWTRITNIISGTDTSARGRLIDSFMFAGDLIAKHNILFGVGPGQVKVLAHDLIINHYQYTGEFADVVRIPNAIGEAIATYGLYGLLMKIFLEIYFFFKTKVYANAFSLGLFIFIFAYQFSGSFLVNVAELGIWALVFACRPAVFQYLKLKPSVE